MKKKDKLLDALELISLELAKVQKKLSELDKEIYEAEENIKNAEKVMKNHPDLSFTMKRSIESHNEILLVSRRKEAVLLKEEQGLSQQKQLIQNEYSIQAQKSLEYKKTQNVKEVPAEVATSGYKNYEEFEKNLRNLRDGTQVNSNSKAKLSKEEAEKELKCAEKLIEKSNEWFKENDRNNPDFNSKLADAEYLFKCKKDLMSVINS